MLFNIQKVRDGIGDISITRARQEKADSTLNSAMSLLYDARAFHRGKSATGQFNDDGTETDVRFSGMDRMNAYRDKIEVLHENYPMHKLCSKEGRLFKFKFICELHVLIFGGLKSEYFRQAIYKANTANRILKDVREYNYEIFGMECGF